MFSHGGRPPGRSPPPTSSTMTAASASVITASQATPVRSRVGSASRLCIARRGTRTLPVIGIGRVRRQILAHRREQRQEHQAGADSAVDGLQHGELRQYASSSPIQTTRLSPIRMVGIHDQWRRGLLTGLPHFDRRASAEDGAGTNGGPRPGRSPPSAHRCQGPHSGRRLRATVTPAQERRREAPRSPRRGGPAARLPRR
jgi:hypothetical protein